MQRSAIYFPLASNASSLLTGTGVASVRRRILLAAILHDRVLLEGGQWQGHAGPSGAMSLWMPPGQTPDPGWQSPRERGTARAGNFYAAMRPDSLPADAPMHRVIDSPTAEAWRATLEPFKAELPRGAGRWQWLEWGHAEAPSSFGPVLSSWKRADHADPDLVDRWPARFVRGAFIEATHKDLAVAIALGAGVSTDAAHAVVIWARSRAGVIEPVPGHLALDLIVPADLTWDDVAEVRKQRALAEPPSDRWIRRSRRPRMHYACQNEYRALQEGHSFLLGIWVPSRSSISVAWLPRLGSGRQGGRNTARPA